MAHPPTSASSISALPLTAFPEGDKADFTWTSTPELIRIIDALSAQRAHSAMFVGGCVRDSFLGNPPRIGQPDSPTDIDIATSLSPDDTMAALRAAGLKAIPTGYDHGTITAVADGLVAEITTLRADLETDGRHATVQYTEDWQQDWRRRDFTINALYVTPDGKLFDPAAGLTDLTRQKVAFIGDTQTRIREDYLRILRFYRFSARYAATIDPQGHAACESLRAGLQQISSERVTAELRKILAGPRLPFTLTAMADSGILAEIIPAPADLPNACALYDLCQQTHENTPELYLAALWDNPADVITRLRLSNAQSQHLTSISTNTDWLAAAPDEAHGRELLYRHGPEALRAASLLLGARDHAAGLETTRWHDLFSLPARWQAPACPFSAASFIARGLPIGPAIGKALAAAEKAWIAADYPRGKATIDQIIDEVAETVRTGQPGTES
ncbi:CCA tRNA nucleotidyltransferase [Parvularcula sp. IMCC14364]|uniref:CCA tRNA nucleotidyltransferase n=1 Tax=Parvularcula sp. IMCC14364 TaxID=3067902 RepID=UPI00274262B3|nr:CCA tRNA nucleotidyltransferase [Parvularcula sp. IMCC14364]